MFTFGSFQFPFHFRRALSPYMVQETLMADGGTSEVLWTHVQHKCHCRYGEPLDCSDWCAKSSAIESKSSSEAASQAGSRGECKWIG
jgi:hypothetical protein